MFLARALSVQVDVFAFACKTRLRARSVEVEELETKRGKDQMLAPGDIVLFRTRTEWVLAKVLQGPIAPHSNYMIQTGGESRIVTADKLEMCVHWSEETQDIATRALERGSNTQDDELIEYASRALSLLESFQSNADTKRARRE